MTLIITQSMIKTFLAPATTAAEAAIAALL